MKIDTFSPNGIPGHFFVSDKYNTKLVIDPSRNFFTQNLIEYKKDYDKLILIHGCEPPLINNITNLVISNHHYFDKIYSFNPEVIEKCKNAELFSFGSCWVTTDKDGNKIDLKKDYINIFDINKKFKISFIRSTKGWLEGHRLRFEVEPIIRENRKLELLFPAGIPTKLPLFTDSMFHLTIENSRVENYFSEKIVDCFMSYTLPIYWGCPNIGEHFNIDGIITFETKEQLKEILDSLTPDDYIKRIDSIKENYQIAYDKYAFFFDRINEKIKDL